MTLQKAQVGIRTQAIMVYAIVLAWYWAFWEFGFGADVKSNHSFFVGTVLMLFPAIAAIFTLILLISSFRLGRSHFCWVMIAALATASTWGLLLRLL